MPATRATTLKGKAVAPAQSILKQTRTQTMKADQHPSVATPEQDVGLSSSAQSKPAPKSSKQSVAPRKGKADTPSQSVLKRTRSQTRNVDPDRSPAATEQVDGSSNLGSGKTASKSVKETDPVQRAKRGRPPGSKNKKTSSSPAPKRVPKHLSTDAPQLRSSSRLSGLPPDHKRNSENQFGSKSEHESQDSSASNNEDPVDAHSGLEAETDIHPHIEPSMTNNDNLAYQAEPRETPNFSVVVPPHGVLDKDDMDVNMAHENAEVAPMDGSLHFGMTDAFNFNSQVPPNSDPDFGDPDFDYPDGTNLMDDYVPRPRVDEHVDVFETAARPEGDADMAMDMAFDLGSVIDPPSNLGQVPGFEDFSFDNRAFAWPRRDHVESLNTSPPPQAARGLPHGSQPVPLPENIEDLLRHWELEATARGFDATQRARMHSIMQHRLNILNNPEPRDQQALAGLAASFDHMNQLERQDLDDLDQPFGALEPMAWGPVQTNTDNVPDLYHNVHDPEHPTWAMPAEFWQPQLFHTSPSQPTNAAAARMNAPSPGPQVFQNLTNESNEMFEVNEQQFAGPSVVRQPGSSNANTQAFNLANYHSAITTDHGNRMHFLQRPLQDLTGQK